jgi:hypothetical protein
MWYGLAISIATTVLFTPAIVAVIAYAFLKFGPRGVSAHALLNPLRVCAVRDHRRVHDRSPVHHPRCRERRSLAGATERREVEARRRWLRAHDPRDSPGQDDRGSGNATNPYRLRRNLGVAFAEFSEATMLNVPSSRGIEDMMDYMAGRIERPSIYMESPSTGAETLYVGGSGLRYLLLIDTDSLEPLVVAFQRFQARAATAGNDRPWAASSSICWAARLLRNGPRSLKTKQTGCPVWHGVLLSPLTQRTRK